MEPSEFKETLNRLILAYGEKFYPDVRCEIIWNIVKEMPSEWFSSLANRWIGSNLKPILADDFREAIRVEHLKKPVEHFTKNENVSCVKCADKGFIYKDFPVDDEFRPIKSRSAKPEERIYCFCYRCTCTTGQLQARNILTL